MSMSGIRKLLHSESPPLVKLQMARGRLLLFMDVDLFCLEIWGCVHEVMGG